MGRTAEKKKKEGTAEKKKKEGAAEKKKKTKVETLHIVEAASTLR